MSRLSALTGWFEHPLKAVTCFASINAVSTFILCDGGKFEPKAQFTLTMRARAPSPDPLVHVRLLPPIFG